LVLVLVVVLVVFGSKRLPDSARALGKSLRILKAETKGLREDDEKLAGIPAPTERFDPVTGRPLQGFDPYTGEPLKPPASPDRPQ
jgi:sec-independent protein translocase protein TatA